MNVKSSNGLNGMRVVATLIIAVFHFEMSYPFMKRKIFTTSFLFVEFFLCYPDFYWRMG